MKIKPGFYWIRKIWSYGPGRWTVAELDDDGIFWLKGSGISDEALEVGPPIREPEIPDGYRVVWDGTTQKGDIIQFDRIPRSITLRKSILS